MSVVETVSKKDLWSVSAITSHDVPLDRPESREFSEVILRSPEARALLKPFKREVAYRAKFENKIAYININNERDGLNRLVWHEVRSVSSFIDSKAAQFIALAEKCDQVFKETDKIRCAGDRAPRSCLSKGMEAVSVTSDILSATANSLGVAAGTLPAAVLRTTKILSAIPGFGVVRGILFMVIGILAMKNGLGQVIESCRLGDYEGALLSVVDVISVASLALLGVGMFLVDGVVVAGGVISKLGGGAARQASIILAPVKTLALKIGPLINILAFVMYGAIGLYATYGIGSSLSFRKQLKEISKSDSGLHAGLVWLKDQVRGADTDTGLKKMWNRFARRTSAECCEMIRKTLTADFLAKVEMGDEQAIKKANELIAKVKIDNGRQLVKYAILLTIAVLGIFAVVGSIKFTGPVAAALFVVGALLWLLVDSRALHRLAAKTFCPDLGCSRKQVWIDERMKWDRTAKKISSFFRSHWPFFNSSYAHRDALK